MKKLVLILSTILIIGGTFNFQIKHTHALDFDDIFNTLTSVEEVWEGGVKQILEPAVKKLAERAFDKVVNQTLNWAAEGFDGRPGFINNWDDFLTGTEYEVLNEAFTLASNTYINAPNGVSNQCQAEIATLRAEAVTVWDTLSASVQGNYANKEAYITQYIQTNISTGCQSSVGNSNNGSGGSGGVAQQNYNNYNAQGFSTGRNIVTTIAQYGAKQLNSDPLKAIINQDKETLTELVGSPQAREEFKNNFSKGGWAAFVAQADPHNLEIGVTSMAKAALSAKASEEINKAIDDQQTPVKFLNKEECTERNDAGDCVKWTTVTPGQQVSAKVSSALLKDEDLAKNADGLIASLISSAVGKITDKLIDQGIAGLTNKINSSLYDATNNSFNDVEFGSQSSFDVLGIQNDGFNNSSSTTTINYGNVSGDGSFIGGPEDEVTGLGGPQIIINLKERLESNINLATEEQSYFNQMSVLRAKNKKTLMYLDQCLPGPDYGWEKRFKDEYNALIGEIRQNDTDEDDKDYIELNDRVVNLGLAQTSDMFNDPRVNIPGATAMKNVINSIVGAGGEQEKARNEQRLQALNNVTSGLSYIKTEITTDFNTQKTSYPDADDLVIFYEDWNELGETSQGKIQQENAFDAAIRNGYYTLKPGESVQSILANNERVAASAVISMAWDIWREVTPKERKSELRFSFYTLQASLSNDEFVAIAESQFRKLSAETLKAKQLLQDCLVLKSYALGKPLGEIQSLVNNGDPRTFESMDENIVELLKYPPVQQAHFGFFHSIQQTGYIDAPNARTDTHLKPFLEQQAINQKNNLPSVFITTAITGDLENSTFGFDTWQDRLDYFNELYPDIDSKDENYGEYTDTVITLANMYKYDRFYIHYEKERGMRGTLFCRHPGEIQLNRKWGADDIGTACLADWYIATDLDYSLAIAGI